MKSPFQSALNYIQRHAPISETTKMSLIVKAYSAFKIPLLLFCNPKVKILTDTKSVVEVGLGFRTQNHLGVMYFGAIAVGAELSVALKAVEQIAKSKKRIDFIFKDFKASFLKRADGDVHFICDEADKVAALVHSAIESKDRKEQTFKGYAIVPSKGPEHVVEYELTLSMKNREA